jgi:hypothetical protein
MSISVGDVVTLKIIEVSGYAYWGEAKGKLGFVHCVEWIREKPIPEEKVPKVGQELKAKVFFRNNLLCCFSSNAVNGKISELPGIAFFSSLIKSKILDNLSGFLLRNFSNPIISVSSFYYSSLQVCHCLFATIAPNRLIAF